MVMVFKYFKSSLKIMTLETSWEKNVRQVKGLYGRPELGKIFLATSSYSRYGGVQSASSMQLLKNHRKTDKMTNEPFSIALSKILVHG